MTLVGTRACTYLLNLRFLGVNKKLFQILRKANFASQLCFYNNSRSSNLRYTFFMVQFLCLRIFQKSFHQCISVGQFKLLKFLRIAGCASMLYARPTIFHLSERVAWTGKCMGGKVLQEMQNHIGLMTWSITLRRRLRIQWLRITHFCNLENNV